MIPRFGPHAQRYLAFRPGYPDAPFDLAAARCGAPLDYAVELGAGSGQATGQILKRFGRVLAVEPDPDMAALMAPDRRLNVRVETAEAVVLGRPDAVFSCTAFHWMDANVVCRRVAQALRPGGVFLAMSYGLFNLTSPEAVTELVAQEMELWNRHKADQLTAWRPYADLFEASGAFARVEPVEMTLTETRTPHAAAGLWLTTSYAVAHARSTGDEDAYCADFTRRVAEASGGGPVVVGMSLTGALGQVADQAN